jgi:hypothetical protein
MSPGVLIAIMFAVVAVLIGGLIVAATHRSATLPPVATANSAAAPPPGAPPAAVPTVALAALSKAAGATYYFIAGLNTTSLLTPPPMPITVASGQPVTLSGWAVDTTAGGAAGGALFALDETTTFQATYGLDRPDVAAALKSATYEKSGFVATLPASALTPGLHAITIKIITADGRSYYAPSDAVTIIVG